MPALRVAGDDAERSPRFLLKSGSEDPTPSSPEEPPPPHLHHVFGLTSSPCIKIRVRIPTRIRIV